MDEIVCTFLNDFKTDNVKGDTWPTDVSAYKVSKVAISAYTRILARKHTDLCINCVHPGYVITDLTWNTGQCTVEEGAKGPVMLALLPDGCPSGQFYCQTELSSFEWLIEIIKAIIILLVFMIFLAWSKSHRRARKLRFGKGRGGGGI